MTMTRLRSSSTVFAWWLCGVLGLLLGAVAPAHAADAERPPSAISALDVKLVPGAPASLGESGAPLVQGGGAPNETIEYYTHDAIGSVRMVFDPAGNVIGQATYSPFGQEIAGTMGMPSQRFTGQERDHEAQLDYFNSRSYQYRTGRFSSVDPIFAGSAADPQSWNRYSYVSNNPLAFVDPSGAQQTTPLLRFTDSTTVTGAGSIAPVDGGSGTRGGSLPAGGGQLGQGGERSRATPSRRSNSKGPTAPGTTCPGDPSCKIIAFGPGAPPVSVTPEEFDNWAESQEDALISTTTTLATDGAFALLGKLMPFSFFGRSALTLDEIYANPKLLGGTSPDQVLRALGNNIPPTWRAEALRQGKKGGEGWVLREYTQRGNETGRMLRWHPGGGHHGIHPYWRVVTHNMSLGPFF